MTNHLCDFDKALCVERRTLAMLPGSAAAPGITLKRLSYGCSQAARSAVKPEMVKLWPLAGAAIMLTSMKAVTIANACARPRLAAA